MEKGLKKVGKSLGWDSNEGHTMSNIYKAADRIYPGNIGL